MAQPHETRRPGVETGQGIWRHTPRDGVMLAFSVAQLAVLLSLAASWDAGPLPAAAGLIVVTTMTAYNIIVVSHLFTHVPWFTSARLNAWASMLNSVDIGQSVQAYHLTHVRNHHRFNNDRKDAGGTTRDTSSTYLNGRDGEHAPLLPYVLGGAAGSFADRGRDLVSGARLWRVGPRERNLLVLAAKREPQRSRELRQIQADRAAHCVSLMIFALISWQWTVFCYLPGFFAALCLVNVQNYFRHYGANPASRSTDSVSHYGRLYNLLTFNDGYHQEHHLSPATHWSRLPAIRERYRARLEAQPRIVSPVPAMLGFLDRRRPLLHRTDDVAS